MQEAGRRVATAALIVAMALWGSSFIALKLAFAELPPHWVIFGRMAVASAVFGLGWRWLRRPAYRAGDWRLLLGLAACEPCLYFLFEAAALQNTSASQAGMITALLPLMVATAAFVFLREQVGRTTWLGFGLAVAGAVWLSAGSVADDHAPAPALGNFFELLAMACATGYILLLKQLTTRYSAFLLTAMQAFVGAVFFLPFALLGEPWPAEVSPAGLAAVGYLGVVVTVGAYGLYNFGVSQMPASQATGFTNLIPVFTVLFATVLLGERLTPTQTAAAALVFAGVGLSQWRSAPPAPAPVLDANAAP